MDIVERGKGPEKAQLGIADDWNGRAKIVTRQYSAVSKTGTGSRRVVSAIEPSAKFSY